MKSQLFDIRREYKKGRLTPGNLNDNPFEQFDHWLNDAIHSDDRHDGSYSLDRRASFYTHSVAERGGKWPFHLLHQLRKQERPATDCKYVYILIFRMAQTGKANTH